MRVLLSAGVVLFFLLAALLQVGEGVDRANFKTCEQSAFCKRHRNKDDNPKYSVVPDSLRVNDTSISGTLKLQLSAQQLQFTVALLEDETVRLFIEAAGESRPRFHPSVALADPVPKQRAFLAPERSAENASFTTQKDGHRVVVNFKPFRVDVLNRQKQLVASINSRNMLKFETFRDKQEGESSEDGFWEESFKSIQDSKPFGSSAVGLDLSFVGFNYVYGLPEHAETLPLKATDHTDPYRLYNLDVFEYEIFNPMALYGSIPFIAAHSKERTAGALWLNAAETWVDIHSSTADKSVLASIVEKLGPASAASIPHMDVHFISESGVIDLFLYLGPTPKDLWRQNAKITGSAPLPALSAIAYHQCRWNYNSQEDLLGVHAKFDEHDIPVDVLWLDIEHTDGKRYFTWDAVKFAEPKEMIQQLESKGRQLVTVVDPHIKRDDGYHIFSEAKSNGYFVKKADGETDYEGHCWPGASSWVDFVNPTAREWWAQQYRLDKYAGSTDSLWTWNDMNEPSVFTGPETTMHKDARHHGGWEHRDLHNLYGQLVHSATYQGHLLRSDNKIRPFVLSRAFFPGSQRTAAVWTGDNAANWDHLRATVPMLLSISIAGLPHVGADVGGFFGNPDPQLLTRWYQAGAFQPFFRAHAHIDTKRREPWLFDEQYLQAMRKAVKKRYTLLPYWYTLFYEHSINGQLVMAPVWSEFELQLLRNTKCFDRQELQATSNEKMSKKEGAKKISAVVPEVVDESPVNEGPPGGGTGDGRAQVVDESPVNEGPPGGGTGDGRAQVAGEVGLPGGGMGTFDVYAVKLAPDPKQPGDKDLLKAKLERVSEWQGIDRHFPTADFAKKKASLKKAYDSLGEGDDIKRLLYIGTSGVTLEVRVDTELRDALLFWFLPHVPPYTYYLLVAMKRIVDALGPKLLFFSYARYGQRNIEAYRLCSCKDKMEGESREADCIYAYNPFTLANTQRPSLTKLYGSDVVPSEVRMRVGSSLAKQLQKNLDDHGLSIEDYQAVCNYGSFHEYQQSDIVKRAWRSVEKRSGGKNRHLLPNPLRELLTECKDEGIPRQSVSNEDLAARMEGMTDEELRFIHQQSGALLKSRTPTPGVKRKQHERGAEEADKDPGGTPKQRRH